MKNFLYQHLSILILVLAVFTLYTSPCAARRITKEEYLTQHSTFQQDTSLAGQSNTFIFSLKHAKTGLAPAQFDTSIRYYNGAGTSRDLTAAFFWCAQAASQDVSNAQAQLGNMYVAGSGTPQNQVKGFTWFLKAAQQNHLGAQAEVGRRYKFGISIDQDYSQALLWLQKAADRGSAKATHCLGVMHALGQGVPVNDSRALELYFQAATQNFSFSQISLANRYQHGSGVTQDFHKSLYWFYQAASQNVAEAWTSIGKMHEAGLGLPRSKVVAYDFYRRAADAGDDEAQTRLGDAYFRGHNVTQDYAIAREWLLKAAAQENAYAQYLLGRMYEDGCGSSPNDTQAVFWYERASSNGHTFASFLVGTKYFIGDGIPPNPQKSLIALSRVAENETDDQFLRNFSWSMISLIHLREGNMDEAKSAIQQALAYKPFLVSLIVIASLLLVLIAFLIAIVIVIYIIRSKSRKTALMTWGVLDAVVVFILLLLGFFAGNVLALFNFSGKTFLTWAILVTTSINLVVLAIPVSIAIRSRWNLKQCFNFFPVKFRTLLAWCLASIACIFLFDLLYTNLLDFFGITVPRQWLQDQVLSLTNTFELQLFIFIGGVVVPIIEELIFRGIIYNGLRSKLPPIFAITTTSVFFAVVHIEPWSILPIFIMSIFLCYSLEKTKSLAVPIVIHCVNNLTSISLLLLLEY